MANFWRRLAGLGRERRTRRRKDARRGGGIEDREPGPIESCDSRRVKGGAGPLHTRLAEPCPFRKPKSENLRMLRGRTRRVAIPARCNGQRNSDRHHQPGWKLLIVVAGVDCTVGLASRIGCVSCHRRWCSFFLESPRIGFSSQSKVLAQQPGQQYRCNQWTNIHCNPSRRNQRKRNDVIRSTTPQNFQ